jgi:hypothetical protein
MGGVKRPREWWALHWADVTWLVQEVERGEGVVVTREWGGWGRADVGSGQEVGKEVGRDVDLVEPR